ncbi:MAG: Transposase, partial [uncultured Cytophagales bacterium]
EQGRLAVQDQTGAHQTQTALPITL